MIKVDKIYSYQAGVCKNGYRSYTKLHFKTFQNRIRVQLPKIELDKEAPISLKLTLYFNLPKSYSKKKKNALKGKYITNNKDLDNLTKGIVDVLADKYDFNDKNIVKMVLEKKYNEDIEDKYCYININLENI